QEEHLRAGHQAVTRTALAEAKQGFRRHGGTLAAYRSRSEQKSRYSHARARFGGSCDLFCVSAIRAGGDAGDGHSLGGCGCCCGRSSRVVAASQRPLRQDEIRFTLQSIVDGPKSPLLPRASAAFSLLSSSITLAPVGSFSRRGQSANQAMEIAE